MSWTGPFQGIWLFPVDQFHPLILLPIFQCPPGCFQIKAFDGRGDYTLGVREQLIFPEIDYDNVNRVRGLDIVIVTTANSDEEAHELLAQLGMPFAK